MNNSKIKMNNSKIKMNNNKIKMNNSNIKMNNSNNLLKDFSAIFYVQHISDPLQFSQRRDNLKIYLFTKTSFD